VFKEEDWLLLRKLNELEYVFWGFDCYDRGHLLKL